MVVQEKDKTLVVITGGTIESGYNPEEGTPLRVPMPKTVAGSAIPELIKQLGREDEVTYLALGMTDSKEMAIAGQVKNTKPLIDAALRHAIDEGHDKIVIVQGSDTMPEHAQYLKRLIEEWAPYEPEAKNKTFIFTGAMKPLRDKDWNWRDKADADGWVNVPRALDDARVQAPGVYVQMGDYIEQMAGDRLPKEAVPVALPGPWEADMIRKHVDEKLNPKTNVLEVERSGFVANNVTAKATPLF